MYALFSADWRSARKKHQCIWCWNSIVRNEVYVDERSVYDHNIQRHRWHWDCWFDGKRWFDERSRYGDCEFTPGEYASPEMYHIRCLEAT
ncbi:hypothetical protein EVB91_222 [Rhizobium phage RHph_I1_18]|nr:hypothetical protein EVB91_222 [Rhizobium phage RHph_I1_18]